MYRSLIIAYGNSCEMPNPKRTKARWNAGASHPSWKKYLLNGLLHQVNRRRKSSLLFTILNLDWNISCRHNSPNPSCSKYRGPTMEFRGFVPITSFNSIRKQASRDTRDIPNFGHGYSCSTTMFKDPLGH